MSISHSFIISTISDITNYREESSFVFADLFAGDGTLAAYFKFIGCNVISNDFFYHNFVINRHYIENNVSMNSDFVIHFNSLSGIEGLIYKNYCATEQCLFSTEAATKCDAIRTELDNLYETKAINDDEYYQLLASLIISVDKYLKSSPNNNYFLLELLPTVDGERGETYNYDPNYLIDFIEGNALYLDPPFNYHPEHINNLILENIANYDNFISINQSC